jgi:hypothetical protein
VFALYACTLDDPTRVEPTYHVLTVEQLPWLEIADDLPRYEYDSRNAAPVSYGRCRLQDVHQRTEAPLQSPRSCAAQRLSHDV